MMQKKAVEVNLFEVQTFQGAESLASGATLSDGVMDWNTDEKNAGDAEEKVHPTVWFWA